MKITFIRPSMTGGRASDAMEPTALMILYSLTPTDIEAELLDERIEKLPDNLDSDIICFSVETFSAKRSYILAEAYKKKKPHIKIIMGGFHPTACPEEVALFADCVVIGDAEPVWPEVISDLRRDNLKSRYISDNSYMLPFRKMDKSVYKDKKYSKISVVQWKRGCVFNCNFCSVHSFYRSCIIEREIDDVIEEISNTKGKLLFLADDNLLHDRNKLKELLIKLAPLKKKWVCQISINVANDDEILNLMSKSGCIVMIIGFESLRLKNLMAIGKKQNISNNDYEKAIKKIYSYGIMIYAAFIFGYPHDTLESFKEVYSFAVKHKFFVTNFNPLMPMPATPLYEELKADGKLIHEKWWLSEDYCYGDAMHKPDNFSAEDLAENCKSLRYRFYSPGSMASRLISLVNLRHILVFLLINIVSAIEIRKKQKSSLGGKLHLSTSKSEGKSEYENHLNKTHNRNQKP